MTVCDSLVYRRALNVIVLAQPAGHAQTHQEKCVGGARFKRSPA
jgi:hypothetical protein